MTPDQYQCLAARTLSDRIEFELEDQDIFLLWNALGLAGEAGEVAEHIKKGVLHQHGIDREHLREELGDVLWYIAALGVKLNISLESMMETNLAKLRARYPDGYSVEASINR